MLDDGPIAAALRELRDRLAERFGDRLVSLTLFGSHARGEARAESDVDVLVLVRELVEPERREVYELGAEVFMATRIPLAPLALSDAEFEELKRRERLLAEDIAREGVAV